MRRIVPCLAVLALLGGGADQAKANFIVTFDSLPANFAAITTHTEGDYRFFALDGGGEHFHTVTNPNNSTTAAQIFSSDGTPHRFESLSATPFDLISIDVFATNATTTFTSSSGATQVVTTPGTVTFGSGFQGLSFFRLDITVSPIGETSIRLDNIRVNAIPEPSSLTLFGFGALGMFGYAWRRAAGRA